MARYTERPRGITIREVRRGRRRDEMLAVKGAGWLGEKRAGRIANRLLDGADKIKPGTSEEYARQELASSVLVGWLMVALFKVIIERMIDIAIEYWKERNAA